MSKRPEKTINKNTAKTAKRLLKYVTDTYKLQFILVFVCIFISAAASVSVSLSLKFMIDDFIRLWLDRAIQISQIFTTQ